MPATTNALWMLQMMKGSVWKMPPSIVMPPVIEPRTTAEPRPVCSPVSDSASDQPMLTPAPKATPRPTTSAVCELDVIAAAKIGASEDTVPSIMPDQRRLHDAQHEFALVLETGALDHAADQRPGRAVAVFASLLISDSLCEGPLRPA